MGDWSSDCSRLDSLRGNLAMDASFGNMIIKCAAFGLEVSFLRDAHGQMRVTVSDMAHGVSGTDIVPRGQNNEIGLATALARAAEHLAKYQRQQEKSNE